MCQTSLEIYRFHGAEAAGDLIQECTDYPVGSKNYNLDFLTNDFWPGHNKLRNNVFDKFFTLEHTVHLAEGGEQVIIQLQISTSNFNFKKRHQTSNSNFNLQLQI